MREGWGTGKDKCSKIAQPSNIHTCCTMCAVNLPEVPMYNGCPVIGRGLGG